MKDNALYFPYISVPNESWTIKTLLYWDKLSSIVPMDYVHAPEELTPFMQQLVQEKLVEQVFPAHHLYKIKDFEQNFIRLIERRMTRTRRFSNKRPPTHEGERSPRLRIHAEKMREIPDFLIRKGIASRASPGWYDVDTQVAKVFMTYLATCLGALDEVNAAAVTNEIGFSRIFGDLKPLYHHSSSIHHYKARNVILDSILPVPNEAVTFDELLRFKSDYGHLLPALRRRVETHCASIASLPNADDRINSTEHFVEQCSQEIEEIVEAMKPTWRDITFGSLAPLFGAGFTWQATDIENEYAYAGSAITFAACAYQAISSIRRNRVNAIRRPLAYLAHANLQLYS